MENRIDIGLDNRTLIFRFQYDPEIISYLKQFRCKWNPKEKYWYIYLDFITPEILQILIDNFYFDIEEEVLSYIESYHKKYIYLSPNKKYFIYRFPINDKIKNYLQNNIGVLWSEKNKVWYSPILVTPFIIKNYNVLKNMGFSFDPELQKFLKDFSNQDITAYLNEKYFDNEVDDLVPKGLSLRQYQKLAVKFIWDKKRVLIGDEMGLGKTIETIVALNKNFKEKTPILVITRTVAVLNWAYEFLKWNPFLTKEKIFVVSSNYMINKKKKDISTGRCVPPNYDIYITNYEMLSILLDNFSKIKFKTLIIDESHRIRHTTRREIIKDEEVKETKTKKVPVKRTKALLTIGKYSEYLIALSGTPLVNRPMDMYVMLKIINPEIFSNKFIFGKLFCNGTLTKWGWDFKGYSNLKELNFLLKRTIMLRRRSSDVLKELPDKQRTILPIQVETKNDLKTLNFYIEKFNENTNHIIEHNKIGSKLTLTAKKLIFSEISKMQNEIFNIKFPLVTSFIKTIIEEKGKCLLYVYYHNAFYIVENWLKQNNIKYETIIGTKGVHEYYNAVKNFQENKDIKVMLLTIGAGSEAITLTASSTVIFLQFDWSPTIMQQAEDRVHRIGQKNAVNAYYIVLDNSCDVSIINMLSQKFKVVTTAIDGYTEDTLNNELFDDFLDLFMKNKGLISKYEPISSF